MCDCELKDKKNSIEHIIPNALGGRLKAAILCKEHNSKLGEKYDADLVDSLATCSNLVNPDRDRGQALDAKFKFNGIDVYRKAIGGIHQKSTRRNSDGDLEITMIGENIAEEAKREARKLLAKIGQKEGRSQEEIEMQTWATERCIERQIKENPSKQGIELEGEITLGKGKTWLGIMKIAVGYAVYMDIEKELLTEKIEILKTDNMCGALETSWYYFPDIYKKNSVCHTLSLIGNKEEGILYCLVSLYNVMNSIVLLSNKYKGDDFQKTYCYDLLAHKEIKDFSITATLTRNEIESIIAKKEDDPQIEGMMEHFLSFFTTKKANEPKMIMYRTDIIEPTKKIKQNKR